jgi:deoxyribodipyrimidine photolyase-related protein
LSAYRVGLIFPNQLFHPAPIIDCDVDLLLLLEDELFFADHHYGFRFHKQKLAYQRSCIEHYGLYLRAAGQAVEQLNYDAVEPCLLRVISLVTKQKPNLDLSQLELCCYRPADFMLEKRLTRLSAQQGCSIQWLANPSFLNTEEDNHIWRSQHKRWFMADFYKDQRRRLDILLQDGQPEGGQWSFDQENRRKIKKAAVKDIPKLAYAINDAIDMQAMQSVEQEFVGHYGRLNEIIYPTTHAAAQAWLQNFLVQRFSQFGEYEDAIVPDQSWLYHSVLSPMLNTGLLTPHEVVTAALAYAKDNAIALNNVEGFIRQIIGWREFMRATYDESSVFMRNENVWQHHRPMPKAFYDATTGIEPVDNSIQRVMDTAYCHHIERLMVLGGFMFLCEIDPKEIYQWFMELFIDAYDWVMVPNIFCMSQNAAGNFMTSKPYFSGSNYILKMSNYAKGDWCPIWDGLFWRWIDKNQEKLKGNPRWSMMCAQLNKMAPEKRENHLKVANEYLERLPSF